MGDTSISGERAGEERSGARELERAVRYLQGESAAFQQAFYVDRSAERWAFTQHPGGFLRKRCHVDCSRLAEEVRALPVSRSPDRAPAARRFDACCTTNR